MKKSKKTLIVEKILKFMAKAVLAKYKPEVVAITGSVGKSSTKESIYSVLSKFLYCSKSEKNYNNEAGLPLTVVGFYPQGKSFFQWLIFFLIWLKLILWWNKYPKVLVLEMGADRPGDIKYLCDMIPVSVGVLTNIGISHLEYFKTPKAIIAEKTHLLKSLPNKGLAVFNYDDENIKEASSGIKSNSVSYGFNSSAQIKATDLIFIYQNVFDSHGVSNKIIKGLSFKINFQGKIIPVRLNGTISKSSVYSTLAAFGVGQYFNLNLVQMAEVVQNQYFLPGRMKLIYGIKRTTIIDDTYNSAPDSLKLAIETSGELKAKRKIAVLGDMLELGNMEEQSHKKAGKWLKENNFDFLISVGKRMRLAVSFFDKNKSYFFDNPSMAGKFLQDFIQEGDLILIKGSQALRMEKVVEEVMAEPNKKEKLLVRQDEFWTNKPFGNQK